MQEESGTQLEILYIEDNPHDAELTARAFGKRNLANRLLVLEDGEKALDYLFARGEYAGRDVNHVPQVILLDLKLPRVSGLEVLR
ncbi:MAG: response regulator, partial [Spirochaetota bacterium]